MHDGARSQLFGAVKRDDLQWDVDRDDGQPDQSRRPDQRDEHDDLRRELTRRGRQSTCASKVAGTWTRSGVSERAVVARRRTERLATERADAADVGGDDGEDAVVRVAVSRLLRQPGRLAQRRRREPSDGERLTAERPEALRRSKGSASAAHELGSDVHRGAGDGEADRGQDADVQSRLGHNRVSRGPVRLTGSVSLGARGAERACSTAQASERAEAWPRSMRQSRASSTAGRATDRASCTCPPS